MKKKTIILFSIMGILLLAGIGTVLVFMVFHVPDFYLRCEIPPGPERVTQSLKLVGRGGTLFNYITNGGGHDGKAPWDVTFNEKEFNSYFQEDFLKWDNAKSLARHGISDLRVAFDEDRIHLGFRYGGQRWETIISFDVRVWLVPKETNLVAIEILGRHAGALPISAQSLLEVIADQARNKNMEVNWYRHNGNPVALVRFQNDRSRPTFQLRRLAMEEGKLTIGGISLEFTQQALLSPRK